MKALSILVCVRRLTLDVRSQNRIGWLRACSVAELITQFCSCTIFHGDITHVSSCFTHVITAMFVDHLWKEAARRVMDRGCSSYHNTTTLLIQTWRSCFQVVLMVRFVMLALLWALPRHSHCWQLHRLGSRLIRLALAHHEDPVVISKFQNRSGM